VETAQVIALIGFLLVATVVALLALRTGSLLTRTREAEGFRGDVWDLARRVETSLGDVSAMIDRVRRRDTEPETIASSLTAARDAVQRYADEARALAAPAVAISHRDAIVHELERAGRALELVEHGCGLYGTGRRIQLGTEADTSIKRGYLNLIHARETIMEQAKAAVLRAEDASPARRFQRRSS
jgi:hypothetical protein